MFKQLDKPTSILPLVVFRAVFGILLFISQTRFIAKGWVKEFFLDPSYHFTYTGFSWINPLPEFWMYSLAVSTAILALFIAFGFLYRLSAICFFLGFLYLELIDKTWYLNHYYFVSLACLLLIFLPAGNYLSIDSAISSKSQATAKKWQVQCVKWLLVLVYFSAGLAKIKYDWLINAQPLTTWLYAKDDLPIIGPLFTLSWVAYLFSWFGMLYDLLVPFFLLNKKTRPIAYVAVIVFHLLTLLLFNIGMFPLIMIGSTLIFFNDEEWDKFFKRVKAKRLIEKNNPQGAVQPTSIAMRGFLIAFFTIQLVLPIRHYFYRGDVLWNEEGFRFAWHVMLVEKNGSCQFKVVNPRTSEMWMVFPSQYLTPIQEKQMSFQPDMIWQFANHLEYLYQQKGLEDIEVYADCSVAVNLQKSRKLINTQVDLTEIKSEFALHKALLL